MQRVERQKHKDRKRGRLAGVLVCAVLLIAGITAGLLLSQSAEEEPPHEVYQPVTGYITQREPEELRSLTVMENVKLPCTVYAETVIFTHRMWKNRWLCLLAAHGFS